MQVEDSEVKLLTEELQLGVKLNQCVHSQRRHDFSLMLSMLVDDVRLHSQFRLPLTDKATANITDESLRKKFSVPAKAPLALGSLNDINKFEQGQLLVEGQLASIRLADAFYPKALAFRDDDKHIPRQVMDNTSLYCQQKKSTLQKQRLPFNVNEWLNSVQETIVNAPLINMTS